MPLNIFRRKKKEEKDDLFDSGSESKSRRINLPSFRISNPFSRKYRIGILLKLKRFLAGILLLIHTITAFMGIENSASLFFLLTGFILLDYLWKTRKS